MKRIMVLLAVILAISAGSLKAQPKIDEAAMIKKLTKLEADSQDPKKSSKPATWINLGNGYIDAVAMYTQSIYAGLDAKAVLLMYGEPTSKTIETIGKTTFEKMSYQYVDVYFANGVLNMWQLKSSVTNDPLTKAGEAFIMAQSLDQQGKESAKISEGFKRVGNEFMAEAENSFMLEKFIPAADMFAAAAKYKGQAPLNDVDTSSIYNAGFIYTISKEYAKAEPLMKQAVELGYDRDGESYFYLFHALKGNNKLAEAKQVLLLGISKYPKNSSIVEGLLEYYTEAGEDPIEIIPYVEKAISNDPKNPALHAGLGQVYDKMEKYDLAAKAFDEAIKISPNDNTLYYNRGLMKVKLANAFAAEMSNKQTTSNKERNEISAQINSKFVEAIPDLEKAFELNPKDKATVAMLKNLYYRLEEVKPEYGKRFEEVDNLLKSMQ